MLTVSERQKKFYILKNFAEIVDMTGRERTLTKWLTDGVLTGYKFQGKWFVDPKAINEIKGLRFEGKRTLRIHS